MLASMRGRLTLGFALSITLFMVLLCAGVVFYSGQLQGAQLARSLEEHAQKYRRDLRDERSQPRTRLEWQRFLNAENATLRDPLSMSVLDQKQNVIASTNAHFSGDERRMAWPASGDWLVETVPTRSHTLILAAPWHSTQRSARDLATKLALVALGVVAATALGSWLLVGQVLSPIDRLSRQAKSASAEELKVRLQASSRDVEVVGLVATLNALLDRVIATGESRGRFYAAASHELRTPIQGLSALLEVGLSRPRESEQWREIATQALVESRRLSALTQDLLALNQLDNQTSAPTPAEMDAADLIERILFQLRDAIAAKKLRIQLDLPDDAEVWAPWNHLEMLFRNLIENAVKYARESSEIRIELKCDAGKFHFSIWNLANLPADFNAEQLFEPFFRLDAARQSQTGGNGLGLSLVASLCRANGWKPLLRAENEGLWAQVDGQTASPADEKPAC